MVRIDLGTPILPAKREMAYLLGPCFALLICVGALGQTTSVGRIIGHIDGISRDGDHYFLLGWACQQGQSKSINVQLFEKGSPLFAEAANLFSEPGVAKACRDSAGGKHRFILALPYGYGPQSKIDVHGIRVVDGVPNDLIAGSGQSSRRCLWTRRIQIFGSSRGPIAV